MWGIILTVIQIFFMLPKIWSSIQDIIELIKLLKTPEEKAEAKAQLKTILNKYKKVNRKDKKQVAAEGANLQTELDDLKGRLQAKVK